MVQLCSSITDRAWENRNQFFLRYCFAILRRCKHRRSRKINHSILETVERSNQTNLGRLANKKEPPWENHSSLLREGCHRITIVTSVSPLSPSHVRRRVRSWLMTRHSRVRLADKGEKKSAPMGRPTRKSIRERRRYINLESVWIPPTGLRLAARTSPGQVRFL